MRSVHISLRFIAYSSFAVGLLLLSFFVALRATDEGKKHASYRDVQKGHADSPSLEVRDDTTFLVVDDTPDRRPIAGAQVAIAMPGGVLTLICDERGRASLKPRPVEATVRATAPGYVGMRTTLELTEGVFVLPLKQTGGVVFEIRGENGSPEDGVILLLEGHPPEVELLQIGPPRLDQRSSRDGTIEWAELAPFAQYKWKCISDHIFEESSHVERLGPKVTADHAGKFIVTDDGTSSFSYGGSFAVTSRLVTRIRLIVKRGAVLRGRVRQERNSHQKPATVKVNHKELQRSAQGDYLSYRMEKGGHVDENGHFLFRQVRPGYKVVKATWFDDKGTLRHASVFCQVFAGQEYDCGELIEKEGLNLRITVAVDPPESVVGIPDAALIVHLSVRNSPNGFDATDRILSEAIEVPIGKPVNIGGLEPGLLHVTCSSRIPMQLTQAGQRAVEFESPVPYEATLQESTEIEFTLKSIERRKLSFACPFLPVKSASDGSLILIPKAHGRIQRVPAKRTSSNAVIQCEGFIEPGDYEGWVYSKMCNSDEFFRVSVSADSGGIKVGGIVREQGATIRGRAFDKHGDPIRHDLHFGVDMKGMGDGSSVYHVIPNSKGEFVLRGVVPLLRLSSVLFKDPIVAGPAGSDSWVELRRHF